mmetsp:Transcript_31774/g.67704  ORF Transcript_31774/g.67704 Transcript_31774/m.67704 type:complete len:207 (-) Transcript_31774:989-1609(-)
MTQGVLIAAGGVAHIRLVAVLLVIGVSGRIGGGAVVESSAGGIGLLLPRSGRDHGGGGSLRGGPGRHGIGPSGRRIQPGIQSGVGHDGVIAIAALVGVDRPHGGLAAVLGGAVPVVALSLRVGTTEGRGRRAGGGGPVVPVVVVGCRLLGGGEGRESGQVVLGAHSVTNGWRGIGTRLLVVSQYGAGRGHPTAGDGGRAHLRPGRL